MQMDSFSNQTEFSSRQPLFQSPEIIPPTQAELEALSSKKAPWFKTKKALLLLIPVFLIILVVLIAARPKDNKQVDVVFPDITSEPSDDFNPILGRIVRLQEELELADPTKTDIVFPPVNMRLELDPAKD